MILSNKESIPKIIIISLITIYLIIMFILYCNTDAVMPDEAQFLYILRYITINNFKDIFNVPNYLGYGCIYWIFLSFIKSLLVLRVINLFLLAIVPFIIIKIQRDILHLPYTSILLSVIVYLSSPSVWFTGKIIGPEIISNTIGIIGSCILLYCIKNLFNKKYIPFLSFVGSFLIGISVGIKLYNIVFAIFIGIYLITIYYKQIKEYWKLIFFMFFSTLGFIISNLIIIRNYQLYLYNLQKHSDFLETTSIRHVLFEKYIEWDIANSSGIEHFIISIFALLIILILGFYSSTDKKLFCSSVISSIFLTIICSLNGTFFGWYLMSILFFILINFPAVVNKLLILTIIANVIIMFSNVSFQIQTKIIQFQHIKNKNEIINIVDTYNKQYNEYEPIYLITTLPIYGNIAYNFEYTINLFDKIQESKKIIFLSDYALNHLEFNEILINSKIPNNKYKYIKKEKDINIILYEPNDTQVDK